MPGTEPHPLLAVLVYGGIIVGFIAVNYDAETAGSFFADAIPAALQVIAPVVGGLVVNLLAADAIEQHLGLGVP